MTLDNMKPERGMWALRNTLICGVDWGADMCEQAVHIGL